MTFRTKVTSGALALFVLAFGGYPVAAEQEIAYSGIVWFGQETKMKKLKPMHATWFVGGEESELICRLRAVAGDDFTEGVKKARADWELTYHLLDSEFDSAFFEFLRAQTDGFRTASCIRKRIVLR